MAGGATGSAGRLRAVRTHDPALDDARAEIVALRARLERQRAEDAAKERHLERYAAQARAASRRERQRARELRETYTATVRALAGAVEARDAYTAHHAERVAAYAVEIGAVVGLTEDGSPQLEFGFLLHDIGKVGVSDAILFKPGALDEEEREEMQRHPLIGEEIIREIEFLAPARAVVRHHHERWDGSGYPDGLAGEEIPLAARVFALADALDAITSDRPYRAATSLADARERLRAAEGQFDPAVLEAFEAIPDERIDAIRARAA
jgi:HD-GYP domain-containing protein (c-di-GMP phosphodiesterase class II)